VLVSDPLVAVLPMWASFPHGQCPDRALKEFFIVRNKKKKKNTWMSLKKNKSLLCFHSGSRGCQCCLSLCWLATTVVVFFGEFLSF
jgi:hypothetical protein